MLRRRTVFVVARNKWSACWTLGQVRRGKASTKLLHSSRDSALMARNKMRSIHHPVYNVFEIPYSSGIPE